MANLPSIMARARASIFVDGCVERVPPWRAKVIDSFVGVEFAEDVTSTGDGQPLPGRWHKFDIVVVVGSRSGVVVPEHCSLISGWHPIHMSMDTVLGTRGTPGGIPSTWLID